MSRACAGVQRKLPKSARSLRCSARAVFKGDFFDVAHISASCAVLSFQEVFGEVHVVPRLGPCASQASLPMPASLYGAWRSLGLKAQHGPRHSFLTPNAFHSLEMLSQRTPRLSRTWPSNSTRSATLAEVTPSVSLQPCSAQLAEVPMSLEITGMRVATQNCKPCISNLLCDTGEASLQPARVLGTVERSRSR